MKHLPTPPRRLLALLSCIALLIGCAAQPTTAQTDTPAAQAAAPGNEANRYNVLFIAVDDLRPELGCYGVDYVQTPNIDRLAASGFLFRQHFVSVPTCGSSRYALLTGRAPANSGVRGSNNAALYQGAAALLAEQQPGAQSLPELFNRSGYHTVLIGKVSHTADGRVFAYNGTGDGRPELPGAWDDYATPLGPWGRGWGIFFAYANGMHREDGQGHSDLTEFVVENDNDLPDGLMAEQAITMLNGFGQSGERFFMGLGFFKPHLPFVAPRQDWEAVADWDIPTPVFPDGIDTQFAGNSGEFYRYRMNWQKTRPLALEDAMQARRAYLACVRYSDRQVGRVLDALQAAGLADNTIVVLWGDHGWMLGEAAMWGKHTPLETAVRSPLIMRVPGAGEPGTQTQALASTIDIYPTLVDACRPAFSQTRFPLDGTSLMPIITGQAPAVRDVAMSYWNSAITARSLTHRLIANRENGTLTNLELYDLREEDGAWVNRAEQQPQVVEQLLQALQE